MVKEKEKRSVKKLILAFFIVFSVLFFIKLFVFDIYSIKGSSMEPAIASGSTVFVNKAAYGIPVPFGDSLIVQWARPKKNDCVIFMYNNKTVIKRCAATGGDPIKLEYSADLGYTLVVEERKIPLTLDQYRQFRKTDKVPENHILAIGDNSEFSLDSRTYGFIPEKNVLGRVLCR